MNILKKIGLYLIKSLFSTALLLLPAAFLFTFIFSQPTEVKRIAKEGGVYDALSVAVSGSVAGSLQSSQQNFGLSNEVISAASKRAFSPSDMEQKGEKLIDGAYGWLNGETESFTPSLDIESNKKVLAESLAVETGKSVAAKPACTYDQLRTLQASNLSQITSLPCQPQGYDIESLKTLFTENTAGLQQNDQVLNQVPALAGTQQAQVKTKENTISLPLIFQTLKPAFYIAIVVLLLCIGLLYALLKDVRKCLLIMAKPLLTVGIIVVIYAVVVQWLLRQNVLSKLAVGSEGNAAQGVVRPFADVSISINLGFGIGYIVLAIILFVIYRQLKPKPVEVTSQYTQ